MLTVGAVGPDDRPARFTVPGPWVDVAAPGTGVRSLSVDGGTGPPLDGTSFAAPLVAGLAALIRERRPGLTAREVVDRITGTARRPAAGRDEAVGSGVVDPVAALTVEPAVLAMPGRGATSGARRARTRETGGAWWPLTALAVLLAVTAAAAAALRPRPASRGMSGTAVAACSADRAAGHRAGTSTTAVAARDVQHRAGGQEPQRRLRSRRGVRDPERGRRRLVRDPVGDAARRHEPHRARSGRNARCRSHAPRHRRPPQPRPPARRRRPPRRARRSAPPPASGRGARHPPGPHRARRTRSSRSPEPRPARAASARRRASRPRRADGPAGRPATTSGPIPVTALPGRRGQHVRHQRRDLLQAPVEHDVITRSRPGGTARHHVTDPCAQAARPGCARTGHDRSSPAAAPRAGPRPDRETRAGRPRPVSPSAVRTAASPRSTRCRCPPVTSHVTPPGTASRTPAGSSGPAAAPASTVVPSSRPVGVTSSHTAQRGTTRRCGSAPTAPATAAAGGPRRPRERLRRRRAPGR